MAAPPAELPGLRSFLWGSEGVYAAEVAPGGEIVEANPALEERAGRPLAGTPLGELVAAPQRPALLALLASRFAADGRAAG